MRMRTTARRSVLADEIDHLAATTFDPNLGDTLAISFEFHLSSLRIGEKRSAEPGSGCCRREERMKADRQKLLRSASQEKGGTRRTYQSKLFWTRRSTVTRRFRSSVPSISRRGLVSAK